MFKPLTAGLLACAALASWSAHAADDVIRLGDTPSLTVDARYLFGAPGADLAIEGETLLRAASERNFIVVEDDYEFEMSFLRPVSPSLKSLDAEGRVVHAGSFSKSIFPGLRLGWLVGSEGFIREARALRGQVLRHPPGHMQRTVAYFLSLGHYDALVNRMKAAFRKRRMAMEEAIAANGLTVAGQGGFGGSSFWMRAPEGVDTEALALQLRGEGVLIEPGRVFFAPEAERRNFYRLAYSSIAPAKIGEGIARIARAMG